MQPKTTKTAAAATATPEFELHFSHEFTLRSKIPIEDRTNAGIADSKGVFFVLRFVFRERNPKHE